MIQYRKKVTHLDSGFHRGTGRIVYYAQIWQMSPGDAGFAPARRNVTGRFAIEYMGCYMFFHAVA